MELDLLTAIVHSKHLLEFRQTYNIVFFGCSTL